MKFLVCIWYPASCKKQSADPGNGRKKNNFMLKHRNLRTDLLEPWSLFFGLSHIFEPANHCPFGEVGVGVDLEAILFPVVAGGWALKVETYFLAKKKKSSVFSLAQGWGQET